MGISTVLLSLASPRAYPMATGSKVYFAHHYLGGPLVEFSTSFLVFIAGLQGVDSTSTRLEPWMEL